MDLNEHLKQLAPLAEAIVYLAEHSAEIETIEGTLSQRHKELEVAEARLKEIDTLCAKAKDGAEQAKAQVIEAQSRIAQMVEGARVEIKRMQVQAKVNLEDELRSARIRFRSEEIKLQEGIADLEEEKKALLTDVITKRKDHDAVVASLASLRNRIGVV